MLNVRIALLAVAALLLAACGAAAAGSEGTPGTTTLPPTTTTAPPTTTTAPPAATTTLPPELPETVSVPDLDGMNLEAATALLGDLGLDIVALPADIPGSFVVAQEPAAGLEVDAGTVVTVDVEHIPTCNPPDPLAPGPGEAIITVLFECAGDAVAPTPGIGVARIVPEPADPVGLIELTLRALLAGPTADERGVGIHSAFDAATADALNRVTLTDGHLAVEFNDAIIVNNMNTSTGMVFFKAELKRNVFLHPEVDTVEFRFNGSCAAWSGLFEADGCRVISRADWEGDLAAWAEARTQ